MDGISRREFLGGVCAVVATRGKRARNAGLPAGSDVMGSQQGAARELVRTVPSFDLHSHPGLFPLKDIPNSANPREYFGDARFEQRVRNMRAVSFWGAFFTLVTDAPLLGGRAGKVRDYEPGEGWREYKRQLGVLEGLLEGLPVRKTLTVADMNAAHAQGEVAAVFGCEGGDHLEGDAGHLEEMHADGMRHMQIYHVASNPLVRFDANGRDAGLTPAGRDVVREMNRLGMVVDLGHASYATTRETAGLTTAPIVQSHALVRREGARSFGLSRDHAIAVADTGGVIGAFGGTANRDIPGYVDNMMHMADVVGVDHVGLGSDMDGTGGRSVFDNYAQLMDIVTGLMARGVGEEDIAKMIGGNSVRVLEAVTG